MNEPYGVVWSRPARRAAGEGLPDAVAASAVRLVIGPLRNDPRGTGRPLQWPLDGIWSAARGSFRVLYRIDDATRTITIETIRHRDTPSIFTAGTGR